LAISFLISNGSLKSLNDVKRERPNGESAGSF